MSPAHYNYFRDYDPGIGRYVQSDPIGLGKNFIEEILQSNTYDYAKQTPLAQFDEDGLNPGGGAILIAVGAGALRYCAKVPSCKKAVEEAIKQCKNVECKFERHKRHHNFGSQGGQYCEHYSLVCYKKNLKGAPPIFRGQWPFPGRCTPAKDNEWLP